MNKKLIRPTVVKDPEQYIHQEWLVTNGLGGYSSGTIIGVMTRKYHGLLIAALPPPLGRYTMLNQLSEEIIQGDSSVFLNCQEMNDGTLCIDALNYLKAFYLEDGLPVWRYQVGEIVLEKRVVMPYRQNTVFISYHLIEGPDQIVLKLSPSFHFRHHEAPVNSMIDDTHIITAIGNRYEISKKDFQPVRIFIAGDEKAAFTIQGKYLHNIMFRIERHRGYEYLGDLWNPGFFQVELKKGQEIALVASTEQWRSIDALPLSYTKKAEKLRRRILLDLAEAQDESMNELVLAADQFIITPQHRIEDSVRAHAFGEEIRTVIAGYHWFTDWGRDTMISLDGLTLCTKRYQEARWILKTFAHYVHEGLIPNMFPEGQNTGLYHTADATLWFFHAIDRYITVTKDRLILEELLPILEDIIRFHIKGTLFGIGMDSDDKLMKEGAENYQLTWMDAKVGDWVVTPRRGKAVEINALWYNALKLMEEWGEGDQKAEYKKLAKEVYTSFNQKFWIEEKGYLYDYIEGENGENSDAFRPNQIFSISLKHPALDPDHWTSVLELVKEKLLTPYGLRTLELSHPDFKPMYEGDLRARDAAYHQGTVWPWLIGPFVDAWLKINPDLKAAKKFIQPLLDHLSDTGIGTISEIFDATPPYNAKGCMAQAWSIAEVLRILKKIQG